METRIRIRHRRKRFVIYIRDGEVDVRRGGWLFRWKASTQEREEISRVLTMVLSHTWPQVLQPGAIALGEQVM